ncbi:MAG: histidine kinase [Anaerolineae bacterium]
MAHRHKFGMSDGSDASLAPSTGKIMMASAYATTAAVYAVTLLSELDFHQPSIWIPLTVLFAAFMLTIYFNLPGSAPLWQLIGLLSLKIGLIFAILLVGQGYGYLPILYFVVIPTAYFSLPFWQANGITALSMLSLLVAFALTASADVGTELVSCLPYIGGMLFFATATAALVRQLEERQRAEQLLAELEDAHQQLQTYAKQVEALAVAEERNRLAREIHDSLGHYLTAMTMQLEAAGKLVATQPERAAASIAKAEEMARESLAEVRRSVAALRASPMDTATLDDAIGELVQDLRDGGIAATFTTQGESRSLPIQVKTALYRAAQEGLTNVRKHANASAVEVALAYELKQVALTIDDNGTGRRGEESGGFGLLGLRERVTLLGGSLEAGNDPKVGFRLHIVVPLLDEGQKK